MPGSTPIYALPYPELDEAANGPEAVQLLAEAADDALAAVASAGVTVVTALPGSPTDGQEVVLVDSLTVPTYAWRLIYVAGITGSNKWVFLGGAPMIGEAGSLGQGAGSGQADLSGGPSLTLPRAGIYDIEWSAGVNMNNGNAVVYLVVNGVTIASVGESHGTGGSGSVAARARHTAAAASHVAKLQYSNAASSSASFDTRRLVVRPFRLA